MSTTRRAASRAALTELRAAPRQTGERLAAAGEKLGAIVNYDNFTIAPELLDAESTGAFMRARLGDALARRDVAPHIDESAAEALSRIRP